MFRLGHRWQFRRELTSAELMPSQVEEFLVCQRAGCSSEPVEAVTEYGGQDAP